MAYIYPLTFSIRALYIGIMYAKGSERRYNQWIDSRGSCTGYKIAMTGNRRVLARMVAPMDRVHSAGRRPSTGGLCSWSALCLPCSYITMSTMLIRPVQLHNV